MLQRYLGETGERCLLDALKKQAIVAHDSDIARGIASKAKLRELARSEVLIVQDGSDNDLHLVLAGGVDIVIKKHTITSRGPGLHVGEMSLIDASAPRSATVVANQATVVASVSEADFAALAALHPELWRRLAIELGNRLRERSKFIKEPNPCPTIFIGSSKESLNVAELLEAGLKGPDVDVRIWSNGVFRASKTTIEDLEIQAQNADFAVLVASPDDVVRSRGKSKPAPRDNVLLELGLFMGALTRERTFLLTEAGSALKLPSDLLGVTRLEYSGERPPMSPLRKLRRALSTFRIGAALSSTSPAPDVSKACIEVLSCVRAIGTK